MSTEEYANDQSAPAQVNPWDLQPGPGSPGPGSFAQPPAPSGDSFQAPADFTPPPPIKISDSEVEIDFSQSLLEDGEPVRHGDYEKGAPRPVSQVVQPPQRTQEYKPPTPPTEAAITAEERLKAKADSEDVMDTLVPRSEPRVQIIGFEGREFRYVQTRLSFVNKMFWFALVGKVVDEALAGDDGLSVNDLFSAPAGARGGTLSMQDLRDADTFVRAISKLIAVAPDFLLDSYMLWLNVPTEDRPFIKGCMARGEDDGGLSDDDGLEIIETFLDQNFEALADFFENKIGRVARRVGQLNQKRSNADDRR